MSADQDRQDRTTLPPRRSAVLEFEGARVFINLSGHGAENGAGRFVFDEKDVDWQPHDEREGCYDTPPPSARSQAGAFVPSEICIDVALKAWVDSLTVKMNEAGVTWPRAEENIKNNIIGHMTKALNAAFSYAQKCGAILEVKLARSEMVEIRDWITRQLEAVVDEQ